MTDSIPPAPICPRCGEPAKWSHTAYGSRHDCCGLHSWGGRPLAEKREAIKDCLRAFDRLWMEHLLFNADERQRKNHAYKLVRQGADLPRGRIRFDEMEPETLQRTHAAIEQIIARHEEKRRKVARGH